MSSVNLPFKMPMFSTCLLYTSIGYRNTKNFSQNIISASYGIHFMRSSFFLHRPRSLLRMSTHIAGTGWAVKSSLLRNGWHCTYLTEDTQFTMDSIINGKKIEFCEAAEFYDEQPHEIQVAVRQRIRWIKGRLACFISAAPRLLSGICQPGKDVYKRQRKRLRKL